MRLKFEHQEEFEQKWQHCEAELSEGDTAPPTPIAQNGKAKVGKSPRQAQLADGGDATVGKNRGTTDNPGNGQRGKFQKIVKDALAMKTMCIKVSSTALELAEQISLEAKWEWARNPQNLGVLESETKDMRSKLTNFHRSWLVEDAAQIKKQFGELFIMENLQSFIDLKPEFVKLQATIDKLKKRC